MKNLLGLLLLFSSIVSPGHGGLFEDECRALGFEKTVNEEGWAGCLETAAEYYDELPRDAMGRTLLHIAAINGYGVVIQFILKNHGAQNSILLGNKDESGNTPLHYAVIHRHREVMDLLLNEGASLQVKNNQGKSALDILFENPLPHPNGEPDVPSVEKATQDGSAEQKINRYLAAVGDALYPAEVDSPWRGFFHTGRTPKEAAVAFANEICEGNHRTVCATEIYEFLTDFQAHQDFFETLGYDFQRKNYVRLKEELLKDFSRLYWTIVVCGNTQIAILFGESTPRNWVGLYSVAYYD